MYLTKSYKGIYYGNYGYINKYLNTLHNNMSQVLLNFNWYTVYEYNIKMYTY